MNYTIAITTFSKRITLVENLLQQIRKFVDNKIILVINGERNGDFNEEYRTRVLQLSLKYKNIYPIFYIEMRGLSKLWNTAIIASDEDNILMLNDDIEILSDDIFVKTEHHIGTDDYTGLSKFNSSFSHFIINKHVIDNVGYFDERLLGFGEEDGDITYRFLKKNIQIKNISVTNVVNLVSDLRHGHIKPGIGKYSEFNRNFIYGQKYKPTQTGQLRGMFDSPMEQVLIDSQQHPYEQFFIKNKVKLE